MDYVDYGEFIFIQMYTNRCNPITQTTGKIEYNFKSKNEGMIGF